MRRSLEYQNLKDSMDTVTWWCHQRSSPFADTELERPSNVEVFLKLANSVALPLWYRELQLMESEDPSTVLDLDRGKAAWTAWKDMFCKTQLTYRQKQKTASQQRSIFEAHVRISVGRPMLAKFLITPGPTRVGQILVLLSEHMQSTTHLQSVAATHHAADDVKQTRRRYRASRIFFEIKGTAFQIGSEQGRSH